MSTSNNQAPVEHYYLKEGDALEIGDEYENEDGQWSVLTEDGYAEWCGHVSHYWPSKYPEMSRFRRPSNKDAALAIRTQAILKATFSI